MTMTSTAPATPSRGWHIGLWVAQIALAGLYAMGAWFHFLPAEEAAKMGAGLLAIQALAIPFHAIRGEFEPLPFNLIYVALAVLVLWGRTRKATIAPRA
jgi:putative oxidoreductase